MLYNETYPHSDFWFRMYQYFPNVLLSPIRRNTLGVDCVLAIHMDALFGSWFGFQLALVFHLDSFTFVLILLVGDWLLNLTFAFFLYVFIMDDLASFFRLLKLHCSATLTLRLNVEIKFNLFVKLSLVFCTPVHLNEVQIYLLTSFIMCVKDVSSKDVFRLFWCTESYHRFCELLK